MQIITLAGQKGGAGKSTLAINLACAWQARGKSVVLLDADPQGTALRWGAYLSSKHAPAVFGVTEDNIQAHIESAAQDGADLTVIDCPGAVGTKLVTAIALSNLVLVPVLPSALDFWALDGVLRVLTQVRMHRPITAHAVFNRMPARDGAVLSVLRNSLLAAGLPPFASRIGDRVLFTRALGGGASVIEHPGSKAAMEIERLSHEVLDVLRDHAEAA